MKQEEAKLQAECFQWAWNTFPETRLMIFHVPNGGSRNKLEAFRFQAMGVIAGVPDIVFLWKGKAYLFEFKSPKGVTKDKQTNWHAKAQHNGFPVKTIKTEEEWQKEITEIIQKTS